VIEHSHVTNAPQLTCPDGIVHSSPLVLDIGALRGWRKRMDAAARLSVYMQSNTHRHRRKSFTFASEKLEEAC